MKKKFIIPIILFLFSINLFSQNDKKVDEYRNKDYFNITRISYINVNEAKLETFSPADGVVVTELPIDEARAYSLQTINGYFFGPYFSASIGLGLDGYHYPDYNTMPIFLDLRFYLANELSSPYIYTDIGHLIRIKNGSKRGSLFNIGIGYKFPINKKRFLIVTDISYSYKVISNDGLSIRKSESWTQIKGIMLGLGVIF